jgi:alkaline phosphatase
MEGAPAPAPTRSRTMKRILSAAFALLLWAGPAGAWSAGRPGEGADCPRAHGKPIARFGVITDIHHTNKPDTADRKYSAGLSKTEHFVRTMNRERVDFVIELGDFVDKLVNDKDPVQNLREVEAAFTSFRGPHYHVLGNHEFDNVTRSDLLSLIHNTGIPAGRTYYSFDLNGIHCVVLDADYTVAEPHRPFDMQTASDSFWVWQDAWIPQEELDWLAGDLARSDLPTVVFTHQLLHRDSMEDHTIKNADVVRGILEADGQVLAVFSGHDHRGEIAFRNGIHYLVLEGNVGMSRDWSILSPTGGLDPREDSPFTLVEIRELRSGAFKGLQTYQVSLSGNAQQYSFTDEVVARP